MRKTVLVLAAMALSVSVALAHHGKDFLIVESYDLPHPGDVYFVSSVAVVDLDDGTAIELEPSLLVGVLPRVAFELHAHVEKEPPESLRFEAIAPSLHLQITPPHSTFPVRVGLSAEYEFAAHNEDNDRFEARLVVEKDFDKHRVALNLIGDHTTGKGAAMGYALGYRYEVTEKFACGIEGQGPVTESGLHEVIAGLYGEPNERITLKAGAGPAFENGEAHLVVRMGAVFKF